MRTRVFAVLVAVTCAGASSASAQTLPGSGDGIRNFGVWLDDASVTPPGGGWVSMSLGYYRSDLFRETDVPIADAGMGISKRFQAGFMAPIYNVGPPGGPTTHGLGDFYIYTKYQFRDPADAKNNGFGLAIAPLIEVLSANQPEGVGRMHWALPVSLELQRPGWRMYGSTGFFSRGSLFASAALERSVTEKMWLTGTLSDSYSTKSDVVPIPDLSRNRMDISGGAGYMVTGAVAVFGTIGRTISMHDVNSTNLALTFGASVNIAAPPPPKARHRPRR